MMIRSRIFGWPPSLPPWSRITSSPANSNAPNSLKKKLKVIALFDAIRPTTIDQDLSKEMKTEDWKTEVHLLNALTALDYPTEHLAIFDDLHLLRQKMESFAPDVLFNLVDQFKNNRGFDQNIA